MIPALEGRLAVNPFGKQIIVERKPESVQEVEIIPDESVEKTIKQYIEVQESSEPISDLEIEILSPKKIQVVLGRILKMYSSESLSILKTSYFVSDLIQISYNSGNNDFLLNLSDSLVNIMGIKGTEKNPLHATIMGNACNFFGNNSEDCIFDIEGDTQDNCGHESKNCRYNIMGNTKDQCGYLSTNSYYNIQKNAQNSCGEFSNNSTFIIQGNVGSHLGAYSTSSNYLVMGNAAHSCGIFSNKSMYDIKGDAGSCCGYSSHEGTYAIGGKTTYLGIGEDTIFKLKDRETYELLSSELKTTNVIQLLDGLDNIICETRK